ncbi:MAG TPA: PQQ-binding-like beta-propeller repeat protein [Terriglobales bacterium]|nr:PQQ-binding-like beta-propeller repeat protein [Terriglobales bacterium]
MKMRTLFLAGTIALVAGCSGSDDDVRCSLRNPATLNADDPGQWPKFRRDAQNTGTIVLAAAAYDSLASSDPKPAPLTFPAAGDEPKGPFVASPVINATQTRTYIASSDGVLYGLELDSLERVSVDPQETPGDLADNVPFQIVASPLPMVSSPIAATRDHDRDQTTAVTDAVFVGGGDGIVYGVQEDALPQSQVWPRPLDTFIVASATLGIDGTVYTNTLGSGFAGICPNGAPRFLLATGASESSPAVGRDADEELDGTLYFGSDDRRVHAVSRDGNRLWTAVVSAPVLTAPVVDLDDSGTATTGIYVLDAAGALVKLDRFGTRLREFDFDAPEVTDVVVSSPALARDRIYAAFDDRLVAIAAEEDGGGEVLWELPAGGRIQSSPAVALRSGDDSAPAVIVFAADDGNLYFVRDDGASATVLNTVAVREENAAATSLRSSPAIAADGTVVIGSEDGRVYAVR